MRFKLVPGRRGAEGWHRSWHVEGDLNAAKQSAQEFVDREKMAVVICEDPEGDVSRQVAVVKPPRAKKQPAVRRAA